MGRYFLFVMFAFFMALSQPKPGFCKREALSHFWEVNFKSDLIIMEGDRYIDANQKELAGIVRSDLTISEKIKAIAEKNDYEAKEFEGAYLL